MAIQPSQILVPLSLYLPGHAQGVLRQARRAQRPGFGDLLAPAARLIAQGAAQARRTADQETSQRTRRTLELGVMTPVEA